MLKLLSKLSLLSRLLLATAMIGAVMLSLAATVLIGNAKLAIEREVSDGRSLARDYVIAAVGSLMRTNSPDEAVTFLPTTLYQPRHVKIAVIDLVNGVTHFPRPPGPSEEESVQAPDWFYNLLAPRLEETQIPIRMGADTFGTVIIITAPQDEIDEVWADFRMLSLIGGGTYIGTLLILAVVLRRALRPLSIIGQAFVALEDGDFSKRVGQVATPDFSPLAERFDRLAETVDQSLKDKDTLNRRLIEAQDAERRTVAMDLHDEFGPCLFVLRVEARSILAEAQKLGDDKLGERAKSVLEIVEQIQNTNRQLLERLRPMEIGQLPLSETLGELVSRMQQIDHPAEITFEVTDHADGNLTEAEELQVYRLCQEAITNALRHASATHVHLELSFDPKGGDAIVLEVTDDGVGWKGQTGSGTRGMKERAQGLGGDLKISARANAPGTRVSARIPIGRTEEQGHSVECEV